jgi:hypothetical protein
MKIFLSFFVSLQLRFSNPGFDLVFGMPNRQVFQFW